MPVTREQLAQVVTPTEIARSASGSPYMVRRPRKGREADWCLALMNDYEGWRDLLDMRAATKIEIEKPLTPKRDKIITGACRADAIVWHGEGVCSIVEAKTDCAPVAIASGLGQLMYYRACVEAYWGVKVEALVMAAPELPALILESIADARLPIRFLRSNNGQWSGLAPKYGAV